MQELKSGIADLPRNKRLTSALRAPLQAEGAKPCGAHNQMAHSCSEAASVGVDVNRTLLMIMLSMIADFLLIFIRYFPFFCEQLHRFVFTDAGDVLIDFQDFSDVGPCFGVVWDIAFSFNRGLTSVVGR